MLPGSNIQYNFRVDKRLRFYFGPTNLNEIKVSGVQFWNYSGLFSFGSEINIEIIFSWIFNIGAIVTHPICASGVLSHPGINYTFENSSEITPKHVCGLKELILKNFSHTVITFYCLSVYVLRMRVEIRVSKSQVSRAGIQCEQNVRGVF